MVNKGEEIFIYAMIGIPNQGYQLCFVWHSVSLIVIINLSFEVFWHFILRSCTLHFIYKFQNINSTYMISI